MKPCAERQMRGLCSHWQPDTGAPAEHGAAAWLSFHPDLLGTGTWAGAPGQGHLAPPAAFQPVLGPEGRERKMLAARHASTALAGGPWASWWAPSLPTWAGCTQTFQQAADGWICFHLLCRGMWVPLCSFSGTAWHFDTIYGVGVGSDGRAGWGKSLPSPWQGRAAPGSPHPAHPSLGGCWGGAESCQPPTHQPLPCACPLPHRPLCCRKRSSS